MKGRQLRLRVITAVVMVALMSLMSCSWRGGSDGAPQSSRSALRPATSDAATSEPVPASSPGASGTAAPISAPQATARTPNDGRRCPTAGLSLRDADGEGSTGHFINFFELRNTSAASCRLFGSPTVTVLDRSGSALADARPAAGFSIHNSKPTVVTVAPDRSAWFAVEYTNLCDAPQRYERLQARLPDDGGTLSLSSLGYVCGPGSVLVSPLLASKDAIIRRE